MRHTCQAANCHFFVRFQIRNFNVWVFGEIIPFSHSEFGSKQNIFLSFLNLLVCETATLSHNEDVSIQPWCMSNLFLFFSFLFTWYCKVRLLVVLSAS